MALSQTVVPSTEPLTTAEVATQYLRIGHSNDNDEIGDLIPAARQEAEAWTFRAFITQTWVLRLCAFPDGPIVLPKPPLSSVTSVTYLDTAGDSQTWASSKYTVETPSGDYARHATIRPAYGEVYPATRGVVDSVTVTYVAGYGAASAVPEGIKRGVGELCRQRYDGEPDTTPMPAVLAPFRIWDASLRFD